MKLVLVHGRDQQGKNAKRLRKQWLDTLQKGLKKNVLDKDIKIEFPFYGDELDRLIKKSKEKLPTEVIAKGGEASDQLAFFEDFLTDLKKAHKITEKQIASVPPDDVIQKGMLNWPWVIRLMRVLDKTKVGGKSIERFTYDVYMYLTDEDIREEINSMVEESIGSEPCVVVGHSLGSVVCYDVLSKMKDTSHVKEFITVGSPLGVNTIKKNLDVPIRMPISSKIWFNAYDPQDFVALNPLNAKNFSITPSVKNYGSVENQIDNHHGIEGYLNNVDVADRIFKALK